MVAGRVSRRAAGFYTATGKGLLHFEKANPLNALIKTDRYIATELLHYKTRLPLVLARYLPPHLVYNRLLDDPPAPHMLAETFCPAYAELARWRLDDMREPAPLVPEEWRMLFNFDYWK